MQSIGSNIAPTADFDVYKIRKDFPILNEKVYGRPLIYLDNAATTQKPQQVLDCITHYYRTYNSNIHRGVHHLSQKASAAYDNVRIKVRNFINANDEREIVFVRGATEAINLIAGTFGRVNVQKDDEILVSTMEHHSNIVPWQLLCEEKQAKLKVIPINDVGEIMFEEFEKLISSKTKIISIAYISNALGTVNPVKEIIAKAHKNGIIVVVDAAQAAPHKKIDVKDLDCDFLAFSSHKMYGPTGVGVLYGKLSHLENMPPYQGGGDMISSVSFEKTTYNEVPFKFEAGTPNVEGVIALGAAIDYLSSIDMLALTAHEQYLLKLATEKLSEIKEVRLIGTAKHKASVLSFLIDGVHSLDAGTLLDTYGIAVRTGNHCAEPLMERLKIPGTIRASFALYNTLEEVIALADGVKKCIEILAR